MPSEISDKQTGMRVRFVKRWDVCPQPPGKVTWSIGFSERMQFIWFQWSAGSTYSVDWMSVPNAERTLRARLRYSQLDRRQRGRAMRQLRRILSQLVKTNAL